MSGEVDPNKTYTPSELVALFQNLPLNFAPGSEFRYSNSNYVLLGYLIERLTGMKYFTYLQANILSQLGMVNTEYGSSNIAGDLYARGYKDSAQEQPADYLDMSIPYAAGALSSNIVDLETWADSFGELISVSAQDNKEIFSQGDYGFGWIVSAISGKTVYLHAGGVSGFSSIIAIFPDNQGLIIALSNVENTHDQLNRIVKAIAENEL